MLISYAIRIKMRNTPGFFRGLNDRQNGELHCKL